MTALLAHRGRHVHSVEIRPSLKALAAANLRRAGVANITLELGDAARGWSKHAPYDVIVLTGSTPLLPDAFLAQLAPGGRLFAVVGEAPVMEARLVTCVAPGSFNTVDLFETVLAPLANALERNKFGSEAAGSENCACRAPRNTRRFMEQITAEELKGWLDDPSRPRPMLLDVREAWEVAICSVPGCARTCR